MTTQADIRGLIARTRAGDQQAAAELVRDYEPHIRRAVRIQLRDPRLRAMLDASDICQSVMASFFARLALGEYDLSQPSHLTALLVTMARSKVATRARRAEVIRRDRRGSEAHDSAVRAMTTSEPGPSQLVAGRDLLEQFRLRLKAEERALSDLRTDGLSWAEIAARLGGSPEALRKRLARALDRVACALGLEEPDEP